MIVHVVHNMDFSPWSRDGDGRVGTTLCYLRKNIEARDAGAVGGTIAPKGFFVA